MHDAADVTLADALAVTLADALAIPLDGQRPAIPRGGPAAVDYARLHQTLSRARLLFVAHRNEILDQCLATFRHAVRGASFGERWISGSRPQHFEHVFDHVVPRELFGLTATPERSYDLSIQRWFDNRIAAELRLWHAIDQQRLCPFMYFGIRDGLDLTDIPGRRGQGYDFHALSVISPAPTPGRARSSSRSPPR